MRVWTKPELIVDTMVLSQAFAKNCDIKDNYQPHDNVSYVYTFKRTVGQHNEDSVSYTISVLEQKVDKSPKDNNITPDELTSYYNGNHMVFLSGQTGIIMNS